MRPEFAGKRIVTSGGLIIDSDFNHRYQYRKANLLIESSREVAQYFQTRGANPIPALNAVQWPQESEQELDNGDGDPVDAGETDGQQKEKKAAKPARRKSAAPKPKS